VILLDQTLLPLERRERSCRSTADLVDAIQELAIRGAPLLGVAGAMGVWLAAVEADAENGDDRAWRARTRELAGRIAAARPTAVNLAWGVEAALAGLDVAAAGPRDAAIARLATSARALHVAEEQRCRAMGRHGASVLRGDALTIVTQCNAGALATGGYGSALGVIRTLHEQGRLRRVVVPETRPLLQGARLTAWELAESGIPHVVMCDNAVGSAFAAGVDGVVVGADRIAGNGDTANKIGTYTLAVLARHHGVPFVVAAPSSTIDPDAACGAEIPIEERGRDEVAAPFGRRTVPGESDVANPAFDVTPAALLSAIVTEQAVHEAPFSLAGVRPR
jgi:methylthioribose-1-phosphate isomerase